MWPAPGLLILAVGVLVGGALAPVAGLGGATPVTVPAAMPAPRAHGLVRSLHPAEVLRVVDGDTFEARVRLWPGLDITTLVRLRGVDAPELKARCAEERSRAEAARDALRRILDQGEVGIAQVMHDKYAGRVVADASTHATPDVATALIEAGLVRRYSGGRRQPWCA